MNARKQECRGSIKAKVLLFLNCCVFHYQAMCNSTNSITSDVFPQKEMLSLKRPETVRGVVLQSNRIWDQSPLATCGFCGNVKENLRGPLVQQNWVLYLSTFFYLWSIVQSFNLSQSFNLAIWSTFTILFLFIYLFRKYTPLLRTSEIFQGLYFVHYKSIVLHVLFYPRLINAIKCLSHPVFMTRTVDILTHVTRYSHPILPNLLFIPCYNQSLSISIYHLIMQAYVSQQWVLTMCSGGINDWSVDTHWYLICACVLLPSRRELSSRQVWTIWCQSWCPSSHPM